MNDRIIQEDIRELNMTEIIKRAHRDPRMRSWSLKFKVNYLIILRNKIGKITK